jgi:hypothetical protein
MSKNRMSSPANLWTAKMPRAGDGQLRVRWLRYFAVVQQGASAGHGMSTGLPANRPDQRIEFEIMNP